MSESYNPSSEAESEGIDFPGNISPVEVRDESGKVTGITFQEQHADITGSIQIGNQTYIYGLMIESESDIIPLENWKTDSYDKKAIDDSLKPYGARIVVKGEKKLEITVPDNWLHDIANISKSDIEKKLEKK